MVAVPQIRWVNRTATATTENQARVPELRTKPKVPFLLPEECRTDRVDGLVRKPNGPQSMICLKRPHTTVAVKPAPPGPLVAQDPLIPIVPTPGDDEADLASWQALPVHLIHALVRAYVAARMSGEEGATPEGRSRILRETRELVWDGILDAVKQVPCPPTPHPRGSARPPRRSQPEPER